MQGFVLRGRILFLLHLLEPRSSTLLSICQAPEDTFQHVPPSLNDVSPVLLLNSGTYASGKEGKISQGLGVFADDGSSSAVSNCKYAIGALFDFGIADTQTY